MRRVDAAVYVSQRSLQQRYPVRPGIPSLARSNVELPPTAFAVRRDYSLHDPARLVAIGSHEQLYKGHDLLIQATRDLRTLGHAVELHLIGNGRQHKSLQDLASNLLPEGGVTFHGHLGDVDRIRQLLDECDLYVQPSRTEGLPRALVEAMARSMPCIGSTAGAIPELLDRAALFDVDNLEDLTARLSTHLNSADARTTQGKRNHGEARTIAELSAPSRYGDFLAALTRGGSSS
ncbi:glycosyltransferase family 4 protein [Propionibacteriaceae bacterium Y1700]|uniref:glycosyltransferase family 4 protein n=1 Tax=Microlunatus sp. Y1700 TaxID=3418487 RepID=UPI003B7C1AD3